MPFPTFHWAVEGMGEAEMLLMMVLKTMGMRTTTLVMMPVLTTVAVTVIMMAIAACVVVAATHCCSCMEVIVLRLAGVTGSCKCCSREGCQWYCHRWNH